MTTPNSGAPEWAAAQETPWVTLNKALRLFDAFAVTVIVDQMDLNDPPASCADGARYLVGDTPTGSWIGHAGELAVASGANAANGWIYGIVATEMVELRDRNSGLTYHYESGNWVLGGGASTSIQGSADFSGTLIDGYVLRYDGSNGTFYLAPDIGSITTINPQTGTSYTLDLGDAQNIVQLTNAGAITLTVPPNSSKAFPIGTVIEIHQAGAGTVTVAPGASVTIQSRGSALSLAGQYAIAALRKVASDTWRLTGDIA